MAVNAIIRWIALAIVTPLIAGCATSLEGQRYRNDTPPFDLFAFFAGDVKAWGIVQNRSGELVQRFTVDIEGTIEGDQLTLDEHFTYGLGSGVEQRVWEITRTADGSYRGTAGDILGSASGQSYGNAFRWAYEMDLPVGESSYRVRFEDWIWALDEQTLMNRSYIQKFGLDFAEVTIFMQRQ